MLKDPDVTPLEKGIKTPKTMATQLSWIETRNSKVGKTKWFKCLVIFNSLLSLFESLVIKASTMSAFIHEQAKVEHFKNASYEPDGVSSSFQVIFGRS